MSIQIKANRWWTSSWSRSSSVECCTPQTYQMSSLQIQRLGDSSCCFRRTWWLDILGHYMARLPSFPRPYSQRPLEQCRPGSLLPSKIMGQIACSGRTKELHRYILTVEFDQPKLVAVEDSTLEVFGSELEDCWIVLEETDRGEDEEEQQ